jgi:hypothetical protein
MRNYIVWLADTDIITFIKFEYDICRNQGAEFDSILFSINWY